MKRIRELSGPEHMAFVEATLPAIRQELRNRENRSISDREIEDFMVRLLSTLDIALDALEDPVPEHVEEDTSAGPSVWSRLK